jgi:predicted nuclease of predicted toxin-antitoxin system
VKVRFQADADLNHHIVLATIRQEPAIDFRSATEAGLAGLPDEEVLAVAARDDRVLVTHDGKTMPTHFADFVQASPSAGVLIVPQRLPVAAAAEDLILLWLDSDTTSWRNQIRWLPL